MESKKNSLASLARIIETLLWHKIHKKPFLSEPAILKLPLILWYLCNILKKYRHILSFLVKKII